MRTREEQISELRAQIFTADCFASLSEAKEKAEAHILEAERRAEQRVRAEIGRDSERLDWLGLDRRGLASHAGMGTYVVTESGKTYVNDDIRVAIDAARNGGE